MALLDTVDITKLLMVEQGSTPANPASGKQKLFVRSSDHVLCLVDSAGTVTAFGAPALTNPMTTAGDIIKGGVAGAPARLAIGASGKILSSDGSAPSWGNGPLTTRGDVITAGVAGAIQRLALGASGKSLVSDGTDAVWGVPTLSTGTNTLSGNVTMTNANQFYDGPSISLAAGTWFLDGAVHVENTSGSSVTEFLAKLWDGTTVESAADWLTRATNDRGMLQMAGIVSPGSTTTYKISVANTAAGCTIRATANNNNPGNFLSWLRAIRVA